MDVEKILSQAVFHGEELDELLGEDVVRPDISNGARIHQIEIVVGFGKLAKPAVRDQRDLVIVVKHHAPGGGHAEVLEKKITGKNVGFGEILDCLAVVDNRSGRTLPGLFSDI